jgi:hypothetical protein
MKRLPWWRQPKVTRWDQGIGLALIVPTMAVLQPAFLGNGWVDSWIAAGSWWWLCSLRFGVA